MTEYALRLDHYQQFFDTYSDTILQGIKEVEYKKESMIHSISTLLDYEKRAFVSKEEKLYQLLPVQKDLKEKELKESSIKLTEALNQYIDHQKQALYTKLSLLDAYSPLKVMKRGYSLSYSNQKIVRSVHDVDKNDMLETKLVDGVIRSKICEKEEVYGNKNDEISGSNESLR